METVRRELLEALAAEVAEEKPGATPHAGNGDAAGHDTKYGPNHKLKVEVWLQDRGVGFRKKAERDGLGRDNWVLKQCPFNSDHGDPDSCIMQDAAGKMSAKCLHN